MRADRPGVVFTALLAFLLVGSPARALTIQPKHETDHQRFTDGTGQTERPESADERIAEYTEWLAFFTAALVVVSTVQIGFLIRADKIAAKGADVAERALVEVERPYLFVFGIKGNHIRRDEGPH
jgi:hypothetical protein